jgi:hypothetical protein
MTTRIRNRFALSQVASVAMAETRLAGRAIPNILRYLAPIVAWTVASVALGIILGFSAVILPPMGAFGIVAVAGLVLLWVMPDLPLVSPGIIRKAFFFMLIADLIIPFYYTVQFSGLPWISARRLATFALSRHFLLRLQRRLKSDGKSRSALGPLCCFSSAPPAFLLWRHFRFSRQ